MRLFDLHCDTLYKCYIEKGSLLSNSAHVAVDRSGLFDTYTQVFAIWIPDDRRNESAWELCTAVLDFARKAETQSAGKLYFLRRNEAPIERARGECTGILAVEGGAAIGGRAERIEQLADAGVKLITLTWNGENEWGYGALSGSDAGLKPFGKAAVRELERCKILPDVSHLNERGFWDVAEETTRPFIASHSLSYAVHKHPRNLGDAQFLEIVGRGGLVGMSWAAEHLGEQSFEQWERHWYHYLELGGENAVVLGGDMDGTDLPSSWRGMETWNRLYDYLCDRGYAKTLIDKTFFKNAADFFSEL